MASSSSFRVTLDLFTASLTNNSRLYPAFDFWLMIFSWRSCAYTVIISFSIIDLIVLCRKLKDRDSFYNETLINTVPELCPRHGLLFVDVPGPSWNRCIHSELIQHFNCTQMNFVQIIMWLLMETGYTGTKEGISTGGKCLGNQKCLTFLICK